MVQELAYLDASRFDGAAHSLAHQLRGQGRVQRPTDDFAAKQIDHHCQVNPACGRRQVRDVGCPLAVGGVGREVLSQFVHIRLPRGAVVGWNACRTQLARPNSRIVLATMFLAYVQRQLAPTPTPAATQSWRRSAGRRKA